MPICRCAWHVLSCFTCGCVQTAACKIPQSKGLCCSAAVDSLRCAWHHTRIKQSPPVCSMQSTNSLAVFLHVFSFGYASSVYLIFGLPFSSTLSRLVRQTTRPRRPLRRSRGSIRHRCPPIWACQQRQWPLSSALRLNRVSRNPPVRTALNWVQNNVGEPLRLRPFGTLHRAWAIAGQIRVWLHLIATDSECIRQGQQGSDSRLKILFLE